MSGLVALAEVSLLSDPICLRDPGDEPRVDILQSD